MQRIKKFQHVRNFRLERRTVQYRLIRNCSILKMHCEIVHFIARRLKFNDETALHLFAIKVSFVCVSFFFPVNLSPYLFIISASSNMIWQRNMYFFSSCANTIFNVSKLYFFHHNLLFSRK